MDLSIITVSWNVAEKLKNSITAIKKYASDLSYEMIIVDNASSDNTKEIITNEFPWVKLISNEKNLGFSKANNQGLAVSAGDYVLFLNPDMLVKESTLKKMVEFMRSNQDVGIASCKLVNESGEILKEVRQFPNIWVELATILKIKKVFPKLFIKYELQIMNYEKENDVDQVRGSFFMVNRKMINKIGAWDERFFVWYEDVDWCKRAHNAGFRVVYTPIAECIDYIGQSFKQARLYHKQKRVTKSMCLYFDKHGKWWEAMLLKIARPVGLLIALIADVIIFKKQGRKM